MNAMLPLGRRLVLATRLGRPKKIKMWGPVFTKFKNFKTVKTAWALSDYIGRTPMKVALQEEKLTR